MDKKSILLRYWQLAAETEGWYPPFADALNGVDATLAAWKPEGNAANTIWETVTHVTYFKERLLRRIQGLPDQEIASNDETFVVRGSSEADWQNAVASLFAVHSELYQQLEGMEEIDLDKPRPDGSIDVQLMDLMVHDAYHTGQIILIRKLNGAWPAHRSFL